MIALVAATALGQDYSFPSSAADYGFYYPTAYKDWGGATDWNCGSLTYDGHHGSDFGAGSFAGMDEGRDVSAAAEGTVIATNDGEFDRCSSGDCAGGGGYGNYVYLEHADGKVTIYAHLKQWSVRVSVGDVVSCGQLLGEMGSSGYSTGPHLHFQVNGLSGYAGDPFDGPCGAPPTWWVEQGPYEGLPGNTCAPAGPCVPVATLTCGDVLAARNDGDGATSAAWHYGCSEFVYSGPERAFTFATNLDEPVSVSLTGLGADLDLYLLDSVECDGTGCLASSVSPDGSDEVLAFEATAGTTYVLVADGWEGAVSDFTLAVACNGTLPVDTGTPPDPPDPGGRDTGPAPEAVDPPSARVDGAKGLAGCAVLPVPAWAFSPLGFVAVLAIRRKKP